MKSSVRPELPTASVGSSQAPPAAVDNSAPLATRPDSIYKSGKLFKQTEPPLRPFCAFGGRHTESPRVGTGAAKKAGRT
jgi:hypothetical protein